MSFEKTEVMENQEITPEAVIAKVREMIDEAARGVFDQHVAKLVDWVSMKIRILEAANQPKIDRVEFGLRAYNRTDGLGLQSVAVGFRSGRDVRTSHGESKDPTIGVVAKGLVDKNAPWTIATFRVSSGQAEHIVPDELLRFDDIDADHEDPYATIPQNGATSVFVNGPSHARTIIQVNGGAPFTVKEPNEGVYTCEYLAMGE